MLSRAFHPNKVLKSMAYNGNVLSIEFKKGQIRQYNNVTPPTFYALFYKTSARDEISYYSTEIKDKFTVLTVKNL